MARRRPDHRWLATAAAEYEPEHPIEGSCWRHVRQLDLSPAVDRALEIYEDQFERERLQPWILAGADDDDINERVGLVVQTIKAYRHLFFDTSVFRDRLELQRWVKLYDGTAEGKNFLEKAALFGLEAVAHVMGADARLDPQTVVESSMRESFFRAQSLRFTRLASPEAVMAHALMKTSVDNSQLLTKVRPANITDVMLKLKTRNMTQDLDSIILEGEVLH